MTAPTKPDPVTATPPQSTRSTPTSASVSPNLGGDGAQKRSGGAIRFWTYLALSGTCAILVPLTVFAVAELTDDGPVRMLLTWVIALLMGSAVYASAAATNTARRRR